MHSNLEDHAFVLGLLLPTLLLRNNKKLEARGTLRAHPSGRQWRVGLLAATLSPRVAEVAEDVRLADGLHQPEMVLQQLLRREHLRIWAGLY